VELWIVSLNRDYLAELGLIDPNEEEANQLLITLDDWIIYKGKRFGIIGITDKALFRGVPILVKITVGR
jgi:hypothetical protein